MTGRRSKDPVEFLLNVYNLVSREGLKAAWDLQQKLTKDLLGLVKRDQAKANARTVQMTFGRYVYLHVYRLVDKINKLKISPVYGVVGDAWPQTEFVRPIFYPGTKHNPEVHRFGGNQGLLNIFGNKMAVHRLYYGIDVLDSRGPVTLDIDTATKDLYGIVLEALETGELARLRMCLECEDFFIAKDPREIYCKPECREVQHRRDAKYRMRESRARRRE